MAWYSGPESYFLWTSVRRLTVCWAVVLLGYIAYRAMLP